MPDEPIHPQVLVEHEGSTAYVDQELAPLIKELWRAGIATNASCQEHEGTNKVWIEFGQPDDARRFLNRALPQDSSPGSMWRRATDWGFGSTMPRPSHLRGGDWEYHTSVRDLSFDERAGFAPDKRGLLLSVSVVFRVPTSPLSQRIFASSTKPLNFPRSMVAAA
jgi:hypothetical protein